MERNVVAACQARSHVAWSSHGSSTSVLSDAVEERNWEEVSRDFTLEEKRLEVVGPIARPADGKSSRDAGGRTEPKTRRRLV